MWALAGEHAPDHGATAASPLVIDLDATLVTAHSEKEKAAPTFKRGFGFHPLWAFADHGAAGTGEPLAVLLRAGNAGSNTAADHIALTRQALRQLPSHRSGTRPGRLVLVRVDGAGSTHAYLDWLTAQRLSYSVGFCLPDNTPDLLARIPAHVWAPALDARDEVRDGAWVADLTGLLNLKGWPAGMRVIARKERPHPGAQLRITDIDGLRVTAFATNTARGQLADLELRHRRRARCEDRIRVAKDTGLTNLPLHSFDANRIWCALVALAVEITAWMQMLALTGDEATTAGARRWEPKRLRHRLFTVPACIARSGRRVLLHLSNRAPWAHLVRDAITALRTLTASAMAPTYSPVCVSGQLSMLSVADKVTDIGPPGTLRESIGLRSVRLADRGMSGRPGGGDRLVLPFTDHEPREDQQAPQSAEGEAKVITLCGSTTFEAEFAKVNQRLTMEGCVVISLGMFSLPGLPDYDWTAVSSDLKGRLGGVHFQKIRMADEVYIVDPGGYVGESTRREIAYAESLGKPVRYLSRERLARTGDGPQE